MFPYPFATVLNDSNPTAVLKLPETFAVKLLNPTAAFPCPVVFAKRALVPTATFPLAVLL